AGAQPYLPSTISTSVPQTPTAIASTSTEPLRASGSCTSSSRALSGFFGSTVIAFICDLLFGEIRLDPSARRREPRGSCGRRPQLHSFPLFRSSHQITSESVAADASRACNPLRRFASSVGGELAAFERALRIE